MTRASSTPDERISVGDLVQIVRWGGCCDGRIGQIFQVAKIGHYELGGYCAVCWTASVIPPGIPFRYALATSGSTKGTPMQWLKRIPPLSELEGQRTEEDLREPA
jgi:hypothetical protein